MDARRAIETDRDQNENLVFQVMDAEEHDRPTSGPRAACLGAMFRNSNINLETAIICRYVLPPDAPAYVRQQFHVKDDPVHVIHAHDDLSNIRKARHTGSKLLKNGLRLIDPGMRLRWMFSKLKLMAIFRRQASKMLLPEVLPQRSQLLEQAILKRGVPRMSERFDVFPLHQLLDGALMMDDWHLANLKRAGLESEPFSFALLVCSVKLVDRINGRRDVVTPMLKIGLAPIPHSVNHVTLIQRLQPVPKLAVNVSKIIVNIPGDRRLAIKVARCENFAIKLKAEVCKTLVVCLPLVVIPPGILPLAVICASNGQVRNPLHESQQKLTSRLNVMLG